MVAGAFYLLSFVSVPTLWLYAPILKASYIVGPHLGTGVIWGGVLEMIVALAGIGTAVALYPVVKKQNLSLALGFVGTRVLEAATIISGVVIVMTIVTLGQAGAGPDALATGNALVAMHNWTFLLGQGFIPAVNALLIGSLLYQSRLVPRILPVTHDHGTSLGIDVLPSDAADLVLAHRGGEREAAKCFHRDALSIVLPVRVETRQLGIRRLALALGAAGLQAPIR